MFFTSFIELSGNVILIRDICIFFLKFYNNRVKINYLVMIFCFMLKLFLIYIDDQNLINNGVYN